MSGRRTRRVRVTRIDADGTSTTREDALAVEEPLAIRINGKPFSVTMRSPGDDFDRVAGFLVSEGVIWAADHVSAMRYCSGDDARSNFGEGRQTFNVIDAELATGTPPPDPSLERHVYT